MGRKWGDRKDGVLLKDIDSMHYIMPLMYPNRCDNEAFLHVRVDLTNAGAYLERKNAGDPPYRYNLFQMVVTAVLKTHGGVYRQEDFFRQGRGGSGENLRQGNRHD